MTREVVFSPEAEKQLAELYGWIASRASPETAIRYVSSLIATSEDWRFLPFRGLARDHIRPGLRITHHKGRTTIAFAVQPNRVEILGIFHGGRDYVSALGVDAP